MNQCRILVGDALVRMRDLPDESVHTCVTSPPYWGGLRDYGHAEQIGMETTPESYITRLVAVFAEVRRALRNDGTLWVVIGDCSTPVNRGENAKARKDYPSGMQASNMGSDTPTNKATIQSVVALGYKQKDLVGIPWMLAFALRADGWYLRSEIVWAKPNCMPESVTDRPTRSHETIFLLAKSRVYAYDADAIKEPMVCGDHPRNGNGKEELDYAPPGMTKQAGLTKIRRNGNRQRGHSRRHDGFNDRWDAMEHDEQRMGMRNKRDVWTVSPAQFGGDHFATFPEELIAPCVLAGCVEGGTVLDPFGGAGTTGLVAVKRGRNAVLIELNPKYADMARARIAEACPMFADVSVEKSE